VLYDRGRTRRREGEKLEIKEVILGVNSCDSFNN